MNSRRTMILNQKRIKSVRKLNTAKTVFAATILALIPLANFSGSALADLSHSTDLSLKLNTASERIVEISEVKVAIVPGESILDRDARLVREAAEAQAAAKASASRNVVARERVVATTVFPAGMDLTNTYKSAAATYGIADWRYLKAIHYIETGCDVTGNKHNPSGATGPMQFLPSTWRSWGADGDGDGIADIRNVVDAVYGAARYLQVSGGSTDIRQALYSYNHSTSYVNKVTAVAMSISQ